MRRLSDERGFTLIEVLVAASLTLLVMGVTMTVLTSSSRQQVLVERHMDAQQSVRTSVDRLARELRNLASPADLSASAVVSVGGSLPRSIERNGPFDLVFRAVDETKPAGSLNETNVMRVRYCLNLSDPDSAVLWQQTQRWVTAATPAMPADTACPGAGWQQGQDRVLSEDIVNQAGGQMRPLFRYAGDSGAITGTDEASRSDIFRVRVDAWVDADPLTPPTASRLSTALFLRNQNREPSAQFTVTGLNTTTRLIDLNGTASQDPEGQLLDYQFYYDPPSPLPDCTGATPHASCILPAAGRLQFNVPEAGTHTYVLKVSDPSGLVGTQQQTFTYPPSSP